MIFLDIDIGVKSITVFPVHYKHAAQHSSTFVKREINEYEGGE